MFGRSDMRASDIQTFGHLDRAAMRRVTQSSVLRDAKRRHELRRGPSVQMSKCPNGQMPECPNTRMYECQHVLDKTHLRVLHFWVVFLFSVNTDWAQTGYSDNWSFGHSCAFGYLVTWPFGQSDMRASDIY